MTDDESGAIFGGAAGGAAKRSAQEILVEHYAQQATAPKRNAQEILAEHYTRQAAAAAAPKRNAQDILAEHYAQQAAAAGAPGTSLALKAVALAIQTHPAELSGPVMDKGANVHPTQELLRRRRAYENAMAGLRIAGLTISPEADFITQAWLRGEISDKEMGVRTLALHGI